jgi:hypothetical protein
MELLYLAVETLLLRYFTYSENRRHSFMRRAVNATSNL